MNATDVPTPTAETVAEGTALALDMFAHAEQAHALGARYVAFERRISAERTGLVDPDDDAMLELWCERSHYYLATHAAAAAMTYVATATSSAPWDDDPDLAELRRAVLSELRDAAT